MGDFALARYYATSESSSRFFYDPNGQFDSLSAGEVVTDTFTYVVSDGTLTDTATVSITIHGLGDANDAPLVYAGADQPASEGEVISFTGVYTDPDSTSQISPGTSAMRRLSPAH